MTKDIIVNLGELLRLKQIKIRHRRMDMARADIVISMLKEVEHLSPETPVSKLNEMQERLRALLNEAEKELAVIEEDKHFVQMLMERGKL